MRHSWLVAFAAVPIIAWMLLIGGDSPRAESQTPAQDEPKKTPEKKDSPKFNPLDQDILARAKLSTDGPALVDFLKKRILPEKDRPQIERLVHQLSSSAFLIRERAALALIERGAASTEVLRASLNGAVDLEMTRRIENALQRIQENDVGPEVSAAVVRVLAQQTPSKLNEILIGYLPFADGEVVLDEIRTVLAKNALHDGKADPVLIAALTDRAPLRRATAGETLGRVALAEHKSTLRKLLTDPDAQVRLRVARMLAFAKQPDAVPVLIDTISDLPLNAAWQVEDILLQLAAQATPPAAPMGIDRQTRSKCRDAWQAWWKTHGAKIDLAKLEETPKMLGRTLIVLLDLGRVLELGPDNQPRWDIKNLVFPLDAQAIGDDRLLVAEHHAHRVTERNVKGEIVWQKAVNNPLVAQRLRNGNTFIATPFGFLEYDKDNQEVLNVTVSTDNQYIMKAMKLPNGEIVCMVADARVVRYSARGDEIASFPIAVGMRLFGGRVHVQPSGRVLVPHNAEGKVVEYDSKGKAIWEVAFEQPIAATRLPNGNTLITSMNPAVGAVEVDRAGTHVWSYQDADNTRVTRAIRR